MAESSLNITYIPTAKPSGEELEKRLGTKHLYLPLCYGYDEIEENYSRLCTQLGVKMPDFFADREAADNALSNALEIVENMPIAVDYTALPRPIGFCRLLAEKGFNMKRCYADSFSEEERADFEWLKAHCHDLEILPTVNVKMEFSQCEEKYLAVGQKAAFSARQITLLI